MTRHNHPLPRITTPFLRRSTAVAALALLAAQLVPVAQAHGRYPRSHFDFYIGSPYWWGPDPFYDPYPYYYAPRTVIIEREPPVYIQRPPADGLPASPQPAPVWYYCTDPAGYYPYVQDCTQPWVSVDPRSVTPPAER